MPVTKKDQLLLDICNLDAGYGKLQILRSVCMQVEEREIIGIIGANGAGKTTVLRAIMNLADIMAGEISFRGIVLNGKAWYQIARMGIGFVPQKREIFAPLTVLENLEVGAYRILRNKIEVKRNLERVLSFFPQLKGKLKLKAGVLSGGEQKMLSIARGLMGSPEVLLLDEPSLGLAPAVAEALFEGIRTVAVEYPSVKALLIVEQNAFLVLEIAQRGYVLEGGRVLLMGSSQELLSNPHVKAAYLSA